MREDTQGRNLLPVILIAVGLLWLLIQTGFVPPRLTAALGSWWPLLLIGGGLDLLLPAQRPARVPFVAIAAAVVLVLGVFWPGATRVSDSRQQLPLAPGTRSVHATIDTSHQPTTITTSNDPTTLIEADFSGGTPGRITTSGGRDARVTVRPQGNGLMFMRPGRWSIALPANLPLSLAVDGASGALNLALDRSSLTELEIDGRSGSITADLPGNGASYRAKVDGGSGAIALALAPGASVDMEADFGSGSAQIFVGEGSDLRLDLQTSSGAVTLDVPESAPVRLDVRDDGSGRLRVPDFLVRRSGSGETGVWESTSFGDGGRVIDIIIRDVGSGSITIR